MKQLSFLVLSALLLAGMPGCKPSSNATAGTGATTVASSAYPGLPTEAQPKLPTIKLWIGSQEMVTEMALTPRQEQTGMMFRTNMGPNEGMIFVMPYPQQASFWMMNTLLPLSAAYIASDGTILEIHDLQPKDTNAVLSATANIKYVLETPQGWFKRNNIGAGTVVTTEQGPLQKVF